MNRRNRGRNVLETFENHYRPPRQHEVGAVESPRRSAAYGGDLPEAALAELR